MVSSVLAIVAGVGLIGGGVWGITFTYSNIARENITTPEDASIPNAPVRGPFTLKAQADIIKTHMLRSTKGKTFAEMPRQIPKVNESGEPVLDANGEPVMTANTARDLWITAMTLITALNLGLIAYALFGLAILSGLISLLVGVNFCTLSRKMLN